MYILLSVCLSVCLSDSWNTVATRDVLFSTMNLVLKYFQFQSVTSKYRENISITYWVVRKTSSSFFFDGQNKKSRIFTFLQRFASLNGFVFGVITFNWPSRTGCIFNGKKFCESVLILELRQHIHHFNSKKLKHTENIAFNSPYLTKHRAQAIV